MIGLRRGAVALALGTVAVAGLAGCSSSKDDSWFDRAASTTTPAAMSTLDNWLAAVCTKGTWFSTTNGNQVNGQPIGMCQADYAVPVSVGSYDSEFMIENDSQYFGSYATMKTDTGRIAVFSTNGGVNKDESRYLQPLAQFGFTIHKNFG